MAEPDTGAELLGSYLQLGSAYIKPYVCEHFSTSDDGESVAKYGDQGCLQMFTHKLEAYDDTNLCTNDVACLSVRSIS